MGNTEDREYPETGVLTPEVLEPLEDLPLAENYEPTPTARKLLAALYNPDNAGIGVREICRVAGVGHDSYYRLIRDPGFQASVKMYAVDATKGKAPAYVKMLEKFAAEGSSWHLKVLLAMSGVYDEKITVEGLPVNMVLMPRMSEKD